MLEVCCGHIESVIQAQKGGADRIELCSALEVGGLTPTNAAITLAKQTVDIPIYVLIRPREGNFIYSELEKQQTILEIASSIEAGADGIVIGALNDSLDLDLPFIRKMVETAGKIPVTFHRAFDLTRKPKEAIFELIQLGITTVLSSGQEENAWKGRALLADLVEITKGEINVLAGCGVNAKNVAELIAYCGLKQVHVSAKINIHSDHHSELFAQDFYQADSKEIANVKSMMNL